MLDIINSQPPWPLVSQIVMKALSSLHFIFLVKKLLLSNVLSALLTLIAHVTINPSSTFLIYSLISNLADL